MKFRAFTSEDYSIVKSWWEQWGWPSVPLSSLPKTGVIVSNGGVDIAALWLYKTDSDMALVEWFISNKEAPRKLRSGCLEALVDEIARIAKDAGYLTITCCVEHKGLIKKLEFTGFSFRTDHVTTLTRVL